MLNSVDEIIHHINSIIKILNNCIILRLESLHHEKFGEFFKNNINSFISDIKNLKSNTNNQDNENFFENF